jgi:hypothetical protein
MREIMSGQYDESSLGSEVYGLAPNPCNYQTLANTRDDEICNQKHKDAEITLFGNKPCNRAEYRAAEITLFGNKHRNRFDLSPKEVLEVALLIDDPKYPEKYQQYRQRCRNRRFAMITSTIAGVTLLCFACYVQKLFPNSSIPLVISVIATLYMTVSLYATVFDSSMDESPFDVSS